MAVALFLARCPGPGLGPLPGQGLHDVLECVEAAVAKPPRP